MSANRRYTLKVITLGRDPIRNICVRIEVDLYNSYSEKSRMCQPFLVKDGYLRFPIHITSNNTLSGPHKEHVYQVWSRSMRSRKCDSKSEARAATLDFG